jgi:hypothetical protein
LRGVRIVPEPFVTRPQVEFGYRALLAFVVKAAP